MDAGTDGGRRRSGRGQRADERPPSVVEPVADDEVEEDLAPVTLRSSRSGSKAGGPLSTGVKPITAQPRKVNPALSPIKLESKLDSPASTPGEQDAPEVMPGRRRARGRSSAPAAVARDRDEPAPKRTRGSTRATRYHDYDDEFEDPNGFSDFEKEPQQRRGLRRSLRSEPDVPSPGDGEDNLGAYNDDEARSESPSESSEDEDEEAVSVVKTRGSRRSRRQVTEVQRYDPVLGGNCPLRRTRARDVALDASEGDLDEYVEVAVEKKYRLRDRSRLVKEARYSPPKEEERQRVQRSEARLAEKRNGNRRYDSRRDHFGRYIDPLNPDPDTIDPSTAWRNLTVPGVSQPPLASPRAAAAVGAGGGFTSGGFGNQPWNEAGLHDRHPSHHSAKAKNAEITPIEVDPSVTFDQVGGMDHYIRALKEMIFLPLVYPELFERFHVSPPRGVLFYGPPGTGKTLVARALAAQASRAGKKVTFFMRKGADILSKWVGEAERQLRLLFEEAQKAQPSIIFFDEIDGLAPVRSSKQDQIHNSIVSTLLALMDGLDSRGRVVVIGATNRIDALDGALRRPGRFDRELLFPLPALAARQAILDIHTRQWAEPPAPELKVELANMCVGYCGADMKALCTEASLHALRRSYPQIYDADEKLLIDPRRVAVERKDFMAALASITPASHRSAAAHARSLPVMAAPLLELDLKEILKSLRQLFPPAAACLSNGQSQASAGAASEMDSETEDDDLQGSGLAGGRASQILGPLLLHTQRPRMLICGPEGSGQAHLGPAVLYALEGLPVHAIGLPSLLSDASARSPEEALVHAFIEARRAAPAVLYLPHVLLWWDTASLSLRATLSMLLADLPPDLPLLLLAVTDSPFEVLEQEARNLFTVGGSSIHTLVPPPEYLRRAYFESLANTLAFPVKLRAHRRKPRIAPPVLPKAPEAIAEEAAREGAAKAVAAIAAYEADARVMRELRMILRDVTFRLLTNRRWDAFAEPPTPEDDPENWDSVTTPMDLATLLMRVEERRYSTADAWLADLYLIVAATEQYWATDSQAERSKAVSRAGALVDEGRTLLEKQVGKDLMEATRSLDARGGLGPVPPGALAEVMYVAPAPATRAAPVRPSSNLANILDTNSSLTNNGDPFRSSNRGSGRLRGDAIDRRTVFSDPEAVQRRIRALKRQQDTWIQEEQILKEESQFEDEGAAAVAEEGDMAEGETVVDVVLEDTNLLGNGTSVSDDRVNMPASDATDVLEKHSNRSRDNSVQEPAAATTCVVAAAISAAAETAAFATASPSAPAQTVSESAIEDAVPAEGAIEQERARRDEVMLDCLEPAVTQRETQVGPMHPQHSEADTAVNADPAAAAGIVQVRANGMAEQEVPNSSALSDEGRAAPHLEGENAEPAAPPPCSTADVQRAASLLDALVSATEGLPVEALTVVHGRLSRVVNDSRHSVDRDSVVGAALEALKEALPDS